jgi:hypothetical protein
LEEKRRSGGIARVEPPHDLHLLSRGVEVSFLEAHIKDGVAVNRGSRQIEYVLLIVSNSNKQSNSKI